MNRVNSVIALTLTAAAVVGFFIGKLDATYFQGLASLAIGFFFGGVVNNQSTPKGGN